METSKSKMKAAYDRNTRRRKSGVGDGVLRQAGALKKTRKLEANWEGPYKVITVLSGGAYELADEEGRLVAREYKPSQEITYVSKCARTWLGGKSVKRFIRFDVF